ncbi:MAG TPA: thymidylate synthase, partial [Dehalococcoidia bacterium]|nr:thymidylate synthase [Dehalococcoidia bacterium]
GGRVELADRGLNYLIRNLLANPTIRYLIVTGADRSGSGRVLQDFFTHGVEAGETSHGVPAWRVRSEVEGYLDLDLPAEALESVRTGVQVIPVARVADVPAALAAIGRPPLAPYAEPRHFPIREETLATFPAEASVQVVRGRKVAEVWVKLLHVIWRFGRVSSTHYESQQKEILDLVSVVSDEDPDHFEIPDFLHTTPEGLARYIPTVLEASPPGSLLDDGSGPKYTYGDRIRAYFGVDQLEKLVEKLGREPESRSAVINLWDSAKDYRGGGSPCLNHLWFRLVDDTLTFTAVIRSNDMFTAWPENAYSLRALQGRVRREVGDRLGRDIALGDLVIVSESAHIYDDTWESVQQILADQYPKVAAADRYRFDAKGNFIIELIDGRIRVEHTTAEDGEHIAYYWGDTAEQIQRQLADNQIVSSSRHALYLGGELQKAEVALRYPEVFRFVQDRDLIPLDAANTEPRRVPIEAST